MIEVLQNKKLSRATQFGDGLFETIAVRNQRLCWKRLHLKRLTLGCKRLSIPLPEMELLDEALTSAAQRIDNGVIKIIVSRAATAGGYGFDAGLASNCLLLERQIALPERLGPALNLGLAELTLASQPKLAGMKHLNRLEQVLLSQELTGSTFDDLLVLDQNQRVIETTNANIFFFSGEKLVTPILDHCGVAGIMRRAILDCASELGLLTSVRTVTVEEAAKFEGAIVCNTVRGLRAVKNISLNEETEISMSSPTFLDALVNRLINKEVE